MVDKTRKSEKQMMAENMYSITESELGKGVVTEADIKNLNEMKDKIIESNDFRERDKIADDMKQLLAETIGTKTKDGVSNYTYLNTKEQINTLVTQRGGVNMEDHKTMTMDSLKSTIEKIDNSFSEIQQKYGEAEPSKPKKNFFKAFSKS